MIFLLILTNPAGLKTHNYNKIKIYSNIINGNWRINKRKAYKI